MLNVTEQVLTYDKWEYWVNRNIPSQIPLKSLDKYFRIIEGSEYLRQNFLKFPTVLQRALADARVYVMPIKSVEMYARLHYEMPDNDRSPRDMYYGLINDIRRTAKSEIDKSEALDSLQRIVWLATGQYRPGTETDYSIFQFSVAALMCKYSVELTNVAVREWCDNTKTFDLYDFSKFLTALANSEYPVEWTASMVQWN